MKVLKNLELFCKRFYCTLVFEAIRSSKNMLNISLKSKLVHYIIFKFCSIISMQSCWNNIDWNTFFECTQYIFSVLSLYRTIHSYLIKLYTVVRKKITPCVKKWPLCKNNTPVKKMSLGEKNLFVKNFIFFVDKLNTIDFNIFNMLKLIFTCKSVAYLLQNSFVNVSFNSALFFPYFLLWLSL